MRNVMPGTSRRGGVVFPLLVLLAVGAVTLYVIKDPVGAAVTLKSIVRSLVSFAETLAAKG